MNNLKVKKFSDSILNNAKLITKGNGFFMTYDLNNGNIIKVVKTPYECLEQNNMMFLSATYNSFIDELYKKLLKADDIQSSSIILPNAIYMSGDIPRAYTIPKQNNMIDLNSFFKKYNDLETISNILLKISSEVKNANKEKINFPDLGTTSNILIDPNKKDIKFIDYDGLQINNFSSFCISGLINDLVEPHVSGHKYYDVRNGLSNNNLDKLSLYAIFLYYTTNTFISDFGPDKYHYINGKLELKEKAFLDYTLSIGIEDTSLEEDLYDLFYSSKIKYPNTSIKRLLNTHILEKKDGKRVFVRKY